MDFDNFNRHVSADYCVKCFAERTEQVLGTILLTTYFIQQDASSKFCLHLLINFRIQTRVTKHNTHTALPSLVYFKHLCVHNTRHIINVLLYVNELELICN